MKQLPLGISDYKELIEGNYYYVDKTLFIKDLLTSSSKVTLIPRPRRFGKTLNLSMLRYFFEKTETSNSHLFENTAIWQDEQRKVLQGQSPVIFLTFKDIKTSSWEDTYKHLVFTIAEEFARHAPTIKNSISEHQQSDFTAIVEKRADPVIYTKSLRLLSEILQKHYQQKVTFLLDEYDAPIHAAYNHGYYDQTIEFMRTLLTSVLKDNSNLERGVITGILRTAKEGIFSGLNNLAVCSILSNFFVDKFGFTSQEVDLLLKEQNIDYKATTIKDWYNGYRAGDSTQLYNPWSILECARNKGLLQPYWVNTSDNQLIKKLIAQAHIQIKTELESLLIPDAPPVIKTLDDAFIFPGIENNPTALWSLLLFSGYITYSHRELTSEGDYKYTLIIPNKEIRSLFNKFLTAIIEHSLRSVSLETMLQALTHGDLDVFTRNLQEFILNSMSVYDIADTEPERSYHLFVLGLLVALQDTYALRSNRESGYGRYDIMLIPHDKTKNGIIIEFKKALDKETLEQAADRALEQIKEKKYVTELHAQGIKNIIVYGVAVQGKNILVKMPQ